MGKHGVQTLCIRTSSSCTSSKVHTVRTKLPIVVSIFWPIRHGKLHHPEWQLADLLWFHAYFRDLRLLSPCCRIMKDTTISRAFAVCCTQSANDRLKKIVGGIRSSRLASDAPVNLSRLNIIR